MSIFGKLVLGVVVCATAVGAVALLVKKLDEHLDSDSCCDEDDFDEDDFDDLDEEFDTLDEEEYEEEN